METVKEANVIELVDNVEPTRSKIDLPVESAIPVKFFRLRMDPFLDNVNPEFFFRTNAHEEAYIKMKRCITDNISLGVTTAISGTGKTLLTQILMSDLDPAKYRPIVTLVYPSMSRTALLREIVSEIFGESPPERATIHSLVSRIHQEIMRLHEEGIKLVIIIDEVHFLNANSLHILRTLSNIEIAQKKLVTILLFGEEIFLKKIHLPSYKSLFSRMFMRARLRPLTKDEVEQYIKFRCLMAGGKPNIFGSDTIPLIYDYTGGIPREINRVCHNALLLAARNHSHIVNARMVKTIIEHDRI